MALSFRGVQWPGVHGELKFANFDTQVLRQQYFGVEGESEIRGYRGGRDIVCESFWFNSYSTAAQLLAAIETINKDAPINGRLVTTGTIARTEENCTFNGIVIKQGPLFSAYHGWWAMVDISWRQLKK